MLDLSDPLNDIELYINTREGYFQTLDAEPLFLSGCHTFISYMSERLVKSKVFSYTVFDECMFFMAHLKSEVARYNDELSSGNYNKYYLKGFESEIINLQDYINSHCEGVY